MYAFLVVVMLSELCCVWPVNNLCLLGCARVWPVNNLCLLGCARLWPVNKLCLLGCARVWPVKNLCLLCSEQFHNYFHHGKL